MDRAGQVEIYNPDPRGIRLRQANFTAEEEAMIARIRQEMANAGLECANMVGQRLVASLPPQQRSALVSADRKFNFAAGITARDEIEKQIGTNIQNYLQAARVGTERVQVTLYGMGHFVGAHDMDERASGLSIAMVENPGLGRSFMPQGATSMDLPDYVWYIRSQRLVKLDSRQALTEFFGPEPSSQAAASERQEREQRCATATAHLQPYREPIRRLPRDMVLPDAIQPYGAPRRPIAESSRLPF